jgi:aryl-alcohol dehydrogenase-like predicted oxidoreductase
MKLGLGTVQFGLPYGATNRRGRVSDDEVPGLLEAAARHGIEVLDTAPAYGDAERLIGAALAAGARFRVVTKTPAADLAIAPQARARALRAALLRSLERLRQERVAGLLLHRCADALAPGGVALIEELQALKQEGLVERIGLSIYEAAELDAVLRFFSPDIVQVPLSVVNQSLETSGHLARLRERGIEVHARSIFLQGVLLAAPADLPPELAPLAANVAAFRSLVHAAGLSPVEGALAFIAQRPGISVALVGVTGLEELEQIAAAVAAAEAAGLDFRALASQSELRNPANWEAARGRAASVAS